MRVQLRMSYEMNRQLQADSCLSLADYDVLVALSNVGDDGMRVSDLAAQIGWERSRLSHQLRRMEQRGLDRTPRQRRGWSHHQRHPHRDGPAGHRGGRAWSCRSGAKTVLRSPARKPARTIHGSAGAHPRQPRPQQLAASCTELAFR
ncbi:MarR family transcriptional regulator [Mycolicibacterium peregrinum]